MDKFYAVDNFYPVVDSAIRHGSRPAPGYPEFVQLDQAAAHFVILTAVCCLLSVAFRFSLYPRAVPAPREIVFAVQVSFP